VRLDYAAVRAEILEELERAGRPVEVVFAFEGADGFADHPEALDAYASQGACLLGVVHRRSNALGGASQEPDHLQRARGLSAAGRAVAERALTDGMLLDVAHASDATFDDLAAVAEAHGAPLVDSHTGMRALVAIDRNLDDARVRRVAATGGVVAIDAHGGHVGSIPGEAPTVDDVVAHVLHALSVAGTEHVALGSDFAGGIVAPSEADGAAWWPVLAARLRGHGVDEPTLAAVFAGNARRVLARCGSLHR
jgi:membrane dipeptidase